MATIDNEYQTRLLFKEWTGVASLRLNQQFSAEPNKAIQNIYSRDIFIEEIPDEAPISIATLDISSAWQDSSATIFTPSIFDNGDPSHPYHNKSFSQIFPDANIEFYKNFSLVPAAFVSQGRVWGAFTDSPINKNSFFRDTIPFKFDDKQSTYLMVVKYNPTASSGQSNFTAITINAPPLFWLLDAAGGYLQFYATTAICEANGVKAINLTGTQTQDPLWAPTISCFKYIGKKGLLNLDISGQQQVIDISGLDADISGIEINLEKLNRMILPDGYVDISGTDYDLCGNEVVRTYYTYNRKNMFVGYENQPILDGSAVNHSLDPSHNNITYELDVSGSLYVSNNTLLNDVSCSNLDVSGDLLVLGHSLLNDVSCSNLDVSGDLLVLGHSLLNDVSCSNLDVSGILNMKCNNIIDTSNIFFCNNTALLGQSPGILTISGDLDMSMNQIITIADATDNSGVPSWGQVQQAIIDGSGGQSYWLQNGTSIYYNTGNVGIGTATPATKLEVIGDVSCGDLILSTAPQDLGSDNLINLGINNSGGGMPSGVLRVNTNSGYIDLGPRNTNWCHIETDINKFYFNKSIATAGGTLSSTLTDLTLSTGSLTQTHITCKSGGVAQVGIGNTNPAFTLDVGGDANLSQNAFVSKNPTQSEIIVDKNLYTRNTNLIDTLKISFETFYNKIWIPMIEANENGFYTNPTTGITQSLSAQNPGKPNAVPTFSSAWGPCVIPIAYLDINQNYIPTPFEPFSGQPFQTAERPDIANTTAYFTIKFAEPYDVSPSSGPINWKTATLYKQFNGSMKSGLGAITEQTITFVAGYIDSYQLSAPNGGSNDIRKPKPFIKVISTNIGNLKCLTGITVLPNLIDPANIDDLTQNMKYYGFNIQTPKIGGICRIIIAESCPGEPAAKEIRNKAWLLLEQQWNVEPWQITAGVNNSSIIQGLVGNHIIDVRMYANNLSDLNITRNPPFINEYNTDWQLVTEQQIQDDGIYSWEKFVLPMGNFASPPVFNIPTISPVTDISYTLMVGGTPCPDPSNGSINYAYPTIVDGANLWEVWLNLKNWPYGITTTEEVFENNVDICGNVIIDGTTYAQAIFATDITCNNLDALNSIDVGPNQKLKLTENNIISTVSATNWAPTMPGYPGPWNPGLEFEAENFYFDCTSATSTRGFIISLGDNTSNTIFRIVDNNNNWNIAYGATSLFQVEGSGLVNTRNMEPWIDMCYNLGSSAPNRYKTLYVGNIDASENVDIGGNLTVDGNTILNGNLKVIDLSATNIDVSNNLNVLGHTLVTDLSATNIDVSNNLNVEGLITGVAKTTFVEYRDYTDDIPQNISDWYCIARTKDTNSGGGADNARGLFILDDNTSGRRQQIIFYAGTSYSRGNYINVIANNWYGSTPTITNLKLETGGIYEGTNLYIYRVATTTADRVYVRLYENTRPLSTGGQWELTATPISGLSNTPVNLDITYNPNNHRANAVSSLDTLLYGDFIVKPPNNDSNNVIDVDREAIRVNYGGYDYTGGSNIIGTPTAIDRVIVDLQAGSTQFGLNVADSGSVIQTLGGIKILPLQSNSLGAPPNYAAPGWGASLFLGEWGWGNQNWNNSLTKRLSQRTNDQNTPGSGNVYCNAIRQNIVYSALNTQGPTWNAGYQGFANSTMYYNQGDIRYIIVDPRQGSNNYATVTLPAIQSPMLGQAITVARTMVPDNFANYDAGLLVKASTGDRINCPHSIFIDDSAFGGISIDPHNVMGNTPSPGFDLPTPYKGNEICSVTLVASQNGYYNTNTGGTSGGSQISSTTQFVWQFISSGSPGI